MELQKKKIETFSTKLFHKRQKTVSRWKKYSSETQMPCCLSNDKAVEPERRILPGVS